MRTASPAPVKQTFAQLFLKHLMQIKGISRMKNATWPAESFLFSFQPTPERHKSNGWWRESPRRN